MKKTSLYFLILAALLFSASSAMAVEVILGTNPSTTSSETVETVFTRTLNVGSSGRDVMALKKIISLEFNTSIESSATFSEQTKTGVINLQEKYATELLIPNGLSAGTGVVGPSTIGKLNQLAIKYNVRITDFVVPVAAVKEVFARTLTVGSVGDDVVLLKNILNSDVSTAVIKQLSVGASNEFDQATADAVTRFQEKYAKEILTPSGMTSGNGIVGPATRKKLNSLLGGLAQTEEVTPSTQTIVEPVKQATKPTGNGITPLAVPTYQMMAPSNTATCPLYQWSYGAWGACQNGMQNRTATQVKIADVSCNSVPNNTSAITSQTCTKSMTEIFSYCSVACTSGNKNIFGIPKCITACVSSGGTVVNTGSSGGGSSCTLKLPLVGCVF
ncbi:MAG: peptidoglycan-binding domain-containing protein [Candidatus Paceibacterota bacterium]|jgi:hypothetical protein